VPDQAKSRKDVVLITGSSGFIGRALGARLKERYRVIGLDVFVPPKSDLETIKLDLTKPAKSRRHWARWRSLTCSTS